MARDRIRCRDDVVLGATELDVGSEEAQYAPRWPSYGIPTLPGFTIRSPLRQDAVVLHVRVPADEDVRVDRLRVAHELVVRGDPRVDRLVGVRGRVADEHAPRPSMSSSSVSGQRGDDRKTGGSEAVGVPGAQLPVAVAALDRPRDRRFRARCARRRLTRRSTTSTGHGPLKRVACDDDLVDALALDLGEHRLERWEIAVDVADRGDAHGARLPREREARPGADEVERRAVRAGRTRSASAGSPLRGYARSPRRARPRAPRRRHALNDVDTTSSGRSRNWYATSTSLEPPRRQTSA